MSYRQLTKAVKLEAGFTAFWGPASSVATADNRMLTTGVELYRWAYLERAMERAAESDVNREIPVKYCRNCAANRCHEHGSASVYWRGRRATAHRPT